MVKIRILFLLALLGLLSACSGMPRTQEQRIDAKTRSRIAESIAKRERASGTGSVSWKTEKRNIAATGVLVLEWPKAMRLEVQDPMGGMVAFLVLQDREFWSYVEEQGEAWSGSLDSPRARKILPLPLSTQDYLRVLLARPPIADADVAYGTNTNTLELSYPKSTRKDLLELDSATEEPRRWRIMANPRAYIEANYSDYVVKSGIRYAGKVRVVMVEDGQEKIAISWQWNDLETYIPKISNIFQIPPSWGENVRTKKLPK